MSNSQPLARGFQFKVGLFVLVGLIGTGLSIILLGGDRISFSKSLVYQTVLSEVPGLFVGSTVSFSGLKVGNVSAIRLNDRLKVELTLKIDPQFEARITKGAIVEIRTQGALGDKYLYIKPGPVDAPVLPSGSVLPADESDVFKLLTDREDGMAKAVDLVKELHILVLTLNQERKLTRTVSNLAEVTEKMKGTIDRIDRILDGVGGVRPEDQKLRQAMTSLASILDRIERGQGSLGQLINDPSVHQSLKSLLGSNQQSSFVKELMRETIQNSTKKPLAPN